MYRSLFLTALVLASCSEEPTPPRGVVLVLLDTLRADRLGCYGYAERPTSPRIDALASEGVLFEHGDQSRAMDDRIGRLDPLRPSRHARLRRAHLRGAHALPAHDVRRGARSAPDRRLSYERLCEDKEGRPRVKVIPISEVDEIAKRNSLPPGDVMKILEGFEKRSEKDPTKYRWERVRNNIAASVKNRVQTIARRNAKEAKE